MKPILFNTDMVRAILDGRKSVTRRVIKSPYYIDDEKASRVSGLAIHRGTRATDGMPYPDAPYRPSDILYVRETWQNTGERYIYKADVDGIMDDVAYHALGWRPSIHMPKEAARLFLRVTDIRVERLQEITSEQIDAEGCSIETGELILSSPTLFSIRWDSTIKKDDLPLYGWDASPWVWVIEFERISKEEAQKDGRGGG